MSIAFGNFVDGICLIYIDFDQKQLDDKYGFVERTKGAKYAIDERGEFVSFKIDKFKLNGFEREAGETSVM